MTARLSLVRGKLVGFQNSPCGLNAFVVQLYFPLSKEALLRLPLSLILALACCAGALFPNSSFGQETLPRIGVGAKMSTLGIGFEAATAVTQRSNVRGGFNFYNYDRVSRRNGMNYDATLTLRSLQITYDHYLVGGFHVSPGVLVYN